MVDVLVLFINYKICHGRLHVKVLIFLDYFIFSDLSLSDRSTSQFSTSQS